MWSDRNDPAELGVIMVAVLSALLLTACSSTAPPPIVEDELVRPAEPLAPEVEEAPSAEAPPEPAPVETVAATANPIHSLELTSEGAQAVVEVVAARPMVWLSQREGERRLVIELPGTFPGPEVEEIATFGGLVAAVLFEADPTEPRTRLVVLTRGPALTSLVPLGDSLQIKLSPAPEPQAAEPPPAEATEAAVGEPAPPAVAPTAGGSAAEVFEVQLGLFSVAANAAGLAADLARRGYPAYVVEVANAGGKVFHTVRLGPYATRQEARRAAAAYRDQEGGETLIRWRERPPVNER